MQPVIKKEDTALGLRLSAAAIDYLSEQYPGSVVDVVVFDPAFIDGVNEVISCLQDHMDEAALRARMAMSLVGSGVQSIAGKFNPSGVLISKVR